MRATVCRTASSVAIYDAKDFSCGLFAPDSQVVAQSEDIGSHVVPLPWSVRSAMEKIGHDLAPGDVILSNDPYAGGTHLNDVTIIYPVFRDGRLIFFPAVRAHWADVGGMVPGSMSGKATEIYQEGVRIPPLKIQEGGRINEAALDLLLANMRVPEERLGDFQASLAACRVAEKRIHEICARYGVDTLLEAVRLDLDRAEARMRACIAALPDGTYHYEDYLETFMGGRFEPLLLPLALTVCRRPHDRRLHRRLAASAVSGQLDSRGDGRGVFIAVKSVFDPQAPLNQGSFRPIEVNRAAGHHRQRAAAGAGRLARRDPQARDRDHGRRAGAGGRPTSVAGDLCRTSFHNLIGGFDARTGREWVHYEWSAGGNGAFAEDDGPSAMATIDWGDLVTVQSSEVIETRMPLLVESSRLATDSGGAGTTRGGLSMQRALRVLAPGLRDIRCCPTAPSFRPSACWAGCRVCRSAPGSSADGAVEGFDTPGKVAGHPVEEGSVVMVRSAGGGGYGDPLRARPGAGREDVREGYVSRPAARDLYGVALDAKGAVDPVATAMRSVAVYVNCGSP